LERDDEMAGKIGWQTLGSLTKALVITGLLGGPLTGCVSAVVGAGATAGVAALEERSAKSIARDTTMATKIRLNLVNESEVLMTGVAVEVYEGRVLLTGVLPTEDLRAQALQLTWKVEQVKDVLNEIQVTNSGLLDVAKDTWITTQLSSGLTFDREVQAINYNIETVNGTVYLIGLAQNQKELDRVIARARGIGGVQRIINHMQIKKAGT
jgi:osmotically-inducible protein OsmY